MTSSNRRILPTPSVPGTTRRLSGLPLQRGVRAVTTNPASERDAPLGVTLNSAPLDLYMNPIGAVYGGGIAVILLIVTPFILAPIVLLFVSRPVRKYVLAVAAILGLTYVLLAKLKSLNDSLTVTDYTIFFLIISAYMAVICGAMAAIARLLGRLWGAAKIAHRQKMANRQLERDA